MHGLAALMEIQSSRLRAGAGGEPVLLEQDCARRDHLLIRRGLAALARAEFERAAALAHNERERDLLLARAAACGTLS